MVLQSWKVGEVIPIYKDNGKPNNPASHRPVPLTSYISKLKKIFHMKKVASLNNCNVISESKMVFFAGSLLLKIYWSV